MHKLAREGTEINLDPEIPGAPSRPVRIIGQKNKIVEARCATWRLHCVADTTGTKLAVERFCSATGS